ncbi:MAG: hypothetical protein AB7P00_37365 [Sandaracinaceae bacterium]
MSDTDGSGFFAAFANAMIERSLPAVREWLRTRFGERASLGTVSVDNGNVRVVDAQLPLGAAVVLGVEEAILVARPEGLARGGSPVRLSSLRGVVRVTRGALDMFEAPVVLRSKGNDPDAYVLGDVEVEGGRWRAVRGGGALGGAEALPLHGKAELRVDARGWRLSDVSLTSGASRAKGSVSGRFDGDILERGDVSLEAARLGHVLDVVEALFGRAPRLPVRVPLDAKLDGIARHEAKETRVEVTLGSDAFEGRGSLMRIGSEVKRAELRGSAKADVLLPESWLPLVSLDRCAPVRFEGEGAGPIDRLEGTLRFDSDAFALREQREPAPAKAFLALREGSIADFDATIDGAARAYGSWPIAKSAQGEARATIRLEPPSWALLDASAAGEPIELTLRRDADGLALTLEAPRLELKRESAPSVKVTRIRGAGRITASGWTGTAEGRLAHGRVRVRVGSQQSLRIEIQRADADAIAGAAAIAIGPGWLGTEERRRLPDGTEGWAELTLDAARRLEGKVHLEAPRSRVSLAPLRVDLGKADASGTVLRGHVAFADLARGAGLTLPEGYAVRGAAEIGATCNGAGSDTRVYVSMRSPELTLETGASSELRASDLAIRAVLDRTGARVEDAKARIFDGDLALRGGWTHEGVKVESLTYARVGDGEARPLLGGSWEDALRGVSIELDGAGGRDAFEGTVKLATAESAVTLRLGAQARCFLAHVSRLEGSLAASDLETWLGGAAVIRGAPWKLEGSLRGDYATPVANAVLRAAAGEIGVRVEGREQRLPFEGLSLEALWTRATMESVLAIEHLSGGRARAELVRMAPPREDARAQWLAAFELDAVELLNPELTGRLGVRGGGYFLREDAQGFEVDLTVVDPRYLVIRRLTPYLERLALSAPSPVGIEPLRVRARSERGTLRVHDLRAAIDGVLVTGRVVRPRDEAWTGQLDVTLSQAWLETSKLLALSARLFGDLVVPVRVIGPGGEGFALHPDLWSAVDRRLAKSAIARGLRSVFDAIERAVRGGGKGPTPALSAPIEPADDRESASTDVLLDRVAREEADADRAVAALLARGMTPTELAARIQRRR